MIDCIWRGAFAFIIATMFNVVLAHQYHVAITNIERDSNGTVEIEHRLFMHDLEPLLLALQNRDLSLDDEHGKAVIRDYVEKRFHIKNASGQALPLQWVGVELDQTYATVYQEFNSTLPSSQWSIENRLLMDIESEVNTVNVFDGPFKQSLVFTAGTPLQALSRDASSAKPKP